MKPSDDKKSLFLDMQQHPENHTEEQIEAMMEELDKPVDVEACWEEFRNRTAPNVAHPELRKRTYRFLWSSIAAAGIILFAIWKASTAISPSETVSDTLIAQSTVSVDDMHDGLRINGTASYDLVENKACGVEPKKEEVTSSELDDVRVRGKDEASSDKEPVWIVNGHRIQGTNALSCIDPTDIKDIIVIKDGKAEAEYEPLYGSQVWNGVVLMALKEGKEQQYAHLWSSEQDGADTLAGHEVQPAFHGGDKALEEFIQQNLKYPEAVPDSSVTGRVIISFIVKGDGSLEDFRVENKLLKYADGTACNDPAITDCFAEEALRVCRMMPQWTPGGRYQDDNYSPKDIKYYLSTNFAVKKEPMLR